MQAETSSKDPHAANSVAEYDAVLAHFRILVTMGFTALGLRLRAVAVLASTEHMPHWLAGLAIVCLSVCIWLLEIRNRVLMHQLLGRGRGIERRWNTYQRPVAKAERVPFSFLHKHVARVRVRILFCEFAAPCQRKLWRIPFSHSTAIDILLLVCIGMGITRMVT